MLFYYVNVTLLRGEVFIMLNEIDREILNKLMDSEPQLRPIIDKINDDFRYTMSKFSHEIRNPLTLINSSLQLIETQHPEVKNFHFWDQTISDVKHLRVLLDELSSYNNSEKLNLSIVKIDHLLTPLIAVYIPVALKSNISLQITYKSTIPALQADPIKLREVFTNLIKNAIESIDGEGSIEVTVGKDKTYLIVEISDTGCGIDPETLDTIFTPFVTYKSSGTGLGLPIIQKIIQSHNGILEISSRPQKGTTFTVKLPFPQSTMS